MITFNNVDLNSIDDKFNFNPKASYVKLLKQYRGMLSLRSLSQKVILGDADQRHRFFNPTNETDEGYRKILCEDTPFEEVGNRAVLNLPVERFNKISDILTPLVWIVNLFYIMFLLYNYCPPFLEIFSELISGLPSSPERESAWTEWFERSQGGLSP